MDLELHSVVCTDAFDEHALLSSSSMDALSTRPHGGVSRQLKAPAWPASPTPAQQCLFQRVTYGTWAVKFGPYSCARVHAFLGSHAAAWVIFRHKHTAV